MASLVWFLETSKGGYKELDPASWGGMNLRVMDRYSVLIQRE